MVGSRTSEEVQGRRDWVALVSLRLMGGTAIPSITVEEMGTTELAPYPVLKTSCPVLLEVK